MRTVQIERKTKETEIKISLNLDGTGSSRVQTGIGFFDHMLTAFAVHSGFDLEVAVQGDLEVDGHHTVEDTGIVLGQAFSQALGNKCGIARYGSCYIPMDESLAFCAVDLSGRPFLVFQGEFKNQIIGQFDTDLTEEFFRAMAAHAGVTLHLRVEYGKNDHHKCEALFKAAAHAFSQAARRTEDGKTLSSKGTLE